MATKTKGSGPPTESIGAGAARDLVAALERAGLRSPRIIGGPSTVSSDGSTAFTVIVHVPPKTTTDAPPSQGAGEAITDEQIRELADDPRMRGLWSTSHGAKP